MPGNKGYVNYSYTKQGHVHKKSYVFNYILKFPT